MTCTNQALGYFDLDLVQLLAPIDCHLDEWLPWSLLVTPGRPFSYRRLAIHQAEIVADVNYSAPT